MGDIDDPFEYGGNSRDGQQQGSSEVPLFPLTEYLDRFDSRNAASAPGLPTAVSAVRRDGADDRGDAPDGDRRIGQR
jgi:hypothetical protein